jgi:hypothetical protein
VAEIKTTSVHRSGNYCSLFAIIVFTLSVQAFGWDWTGFNGGESKITITALNKGKTLEQLF